MSWTRRHLLQSALAGAGVAAAARAMPAGDDADVPLKTLAHARGITFGTALSGRGLADERYVELIRTQCNILVPENELKMPFIQPRPGEFNFERAEKLLAFAAANHMAVRGHCLLWHHPRWLPRWMEGYDFGAEPSKAAEQLLVGHITRTATHFGRRVGSWDVVNEAVDNISGEMRDTVLSRAIGSPDKVLEIAFRTARALLPDTELVYNDYMGWESNNAAQRDGVLRLLERLRKQGVPVNALGIQAHIGSGNQDSNNSRVFDARDEKAWRKFLEEVTGMGYALLITEFDVHDATVPGDIAERDRQVAALGRAFLDVTLSFTQVNALLTWGLADSYTWLRGRNPRADGLPKRPTPYDEQFRPKLLREAIASALRAAPARRAAAIAGTPA
jgi:endo-1,4-beta-xylanase